MGGRGEEGGREGPLLPSLEANPLSEVKSVVGIPGQELGVGMPRQLWRRKMPGVISRQRHPAASPLPPPPEASCPASLLLTPLRSEGPLAVVAQSDASHGSCCLGTKG